MWPVIGSEILSNHQYFDTLPLNWCCWERW